MWRRARGLQSKRLPGHKQPALPSSPATCFGTQVLEEVQLQAGSLTLQGTLEAPSFPSRPHSHSPDWLNQQPFTGAFSFVFHCLGSGQRGRGAAQEWMPRGARAQKMVLYVMFPHHTLFQSQLTEMLPLIQNGSLFSGCAPLETFFFSLRGICFPYWEYISLNSRMIASCLR